MWKVILTAWLAQGLYMYNVHTCKYVCIYPKRVDVIRCWYSTGPAIRISTRISKMQALNYSQLHSTFSLHLELHVTYSARKSSGFIKIHLHWMRGKHILSERGFHAQYTYCNWRHNCNRNDYNRPHTPSFQCVHTAMIGPALLLALLLPHAQLIIEWMKEKINKTSKQIKYHTCNALLFQLGDRNFRSILLGLRVHLDNGSGGRVMPWHIGNRWHFGR